MPMATKELQREYQRKWMAARRAEWFSDKFCIDCGSKDKLEIDHRDRDLKITNAVWSWAKHRRDEELAKCDVRCSDCHHKRHSKRPWVSAKLRNQGPPGTHWCGMHKLYLEENKFSKDRFRWNGVQDICKECRSKCRSKKVRAPILLGEDAASKTA
jgi:hypothetical protein